MSGARDLLLLLLALAVPLLGERALRIARGPAPLGPVERAPPCEVPVEVAGAGVACVAPEVARAARTRAGDRLRLDGGALRRERMAPARLRAWGAPVDVNRATPGELASLDGIGPRLAERIVLARPFRSVDDVATVSGIGPRRLAKIRDRLTLDE